MADPSRREKRSRSFCPFRKLNFGDSAGHSTSPALGHASFLRTRDPPSPHLQRGRSYLFADDGVMRLTCTAVPPRLTRTLDWQCRFGEGYRPSFFHSALAVFAALATAHPAQPRDTRVDGLDWSRNAHAQCEVCLDRFSVLAPFGFRAPVQSAGIVPPSLGDLFRIDAPLSPHQANDLEAAARGCSTPRGRACSCAWCSTPASMPSARDTYFRCLPARIHCACGGFTPWSGLLAQFSLCGWRVLD